MLDEFVGGNADEAGCEPALRRKDLVRALGEFAHRFRNGNILGQVEVMKPVFPRHARDGDVAEIGQSGHHGDRFVSLYVRRQRGPVRDIKVEGFKIIQAMSLGDLGGCAWLRIGQLHAIVAAFGE